MSQPPLECKYEIIIGARAKSVRLLCVCVVGGRGVRNCAMLPLGVFMPLWTLVGCLGKCDIGMRFLHAATRNVYFYFFYRYEYLRSLRSYLFSSFYQFIFHLSSKLLINFLRYTIRTIFTWKAVKMYPISKLRLYNKCKMLQK